MSLNSYFNIDTYGRLLTFAIFVIAGLDVSKNIPRPKNLYSWLALVSIVAIAGFIGIKVRFISILGYSVFLNETILGFSSGVIVGFVLRMRLKFWMR